MANQTIDIISNDLKGINENENTPSDNDENLNNIGNHSDRKNINSKINSFKEKNQSDNLTSLSLPIILDEENDLNKLIDKINKIGLSSSENKDSYIEQQWGKVTIPDYSTVFLRGKNYLIDRKKFVSDSMVLPLVACECWKIEDRIDHIARHPSLWYANNIDPNDMSKFVVIIHLQVPSIKTSFVHYHILEGGIPSRTNDPIFNNLFDKFILEDDEFRNNRLKLIPRIVKGPSIVKKAVENRPVILGRQVKHQYFIGKNYIEIDSQVDFSYFAAGIIKLAHSFSKQLIVDMCWTIEGKNEEELPEKFMCGIQVHYLNFKKRIPLNNINESQYYDYTKLSNSSLNSSSSPPS